MSENSFRTVVRTDRSPAEVYAAVLDVRGWWSVHLEGASAAVGDVFVFEVPGKHRSEIRVAEAEPDERVVWDVLDTTILFVGDQKEWVGTQVRFEIRQQDGATELTFTHDGLVPSFECYEACSSGWTFFVEESLRDLIETGTGRPHVREGEALPR